MKNKYRLLVSTSLLFLTITTFSKIYLNLIFDPVNGKVILKILNLPTALIVLTLVNLFVIFITACGSNIFLNLLNNKVKLKNNKTKTHIYLVYFVGYTSVNCISLTYTLISRRVINLFQLNIISLVFFIVLSIFIFQIENNIRGKKTALMATSIIFILNAIVPILSVLQRII